MNERQRSCSGQFGELLYPNDWQCTKCGTWHFGKSVAKYCCKEE